MAYNKRNTEREMFDEPQGDVVLEISDSKVVVVQQNEFNGEPYFHIRQNWKNSDGEWGIGKGLAIPADLANELYAGLTEWFENNKVVGKKKRVAEKATSKNKKVVEEEERPARRTTRKPEPVKNTRKRAEPEPVKTTRKTATASKKPGKASRLADF